MSYYYLCTTTVLHCLIFLHTYFYAEVAVSPNNNVVNIYEKKGKEWVKIHELTEHSGRITGTAASINQQCLIDNLILKINKLLFLIGQTNIVIGVPTSLCSYKGTDQYFSLNSNCCLQHQRTPVRTLLHRAQHSVSEEEDRLMEVQQL